MIKRYEDSDIRTIWSDENKLNLWQRTELAVVEAMVTLKVIGTGGAFDMIKAAVTGHPIDLEWWHQRDKVIYHDLNAFLDERLRFIPKALQRWWHRKITSYDTQEAAFATMLAKSVDMVNQYTPRLMDAIRSLALTYRYTLMRGRSHGQGGELQTFGARCLIWYQELQYAFKFLDLACQNLKYSKISGAMGKYGTINPELEKIALGIMQLVPYYGATQIMPRSLYVPLAAALANLCLILDKVARDIRLGARSPYPICQEYFNPEQKGSSAMPDKRNPVKCENVQGLARAAIGYLLMILPNVVTDEERSIEQSSVERIAWPDLFHVTIRAVKVMTEVLPKLEVYPDNMMREIVQSCGCYASSDAKELLKEFGEEFGVEADDCYRMVQLASFNLQEVHEELRMLRTVPAQSLEEAEALLSSFPRLDMVGPHTLLQTIISSGTLRPSPKLAFTRETVEQWNRTLLEIFSDSENRKKWDEIFRPTVLLANEKILFREILGVD